MLDDVERRALLVEPAGKDPPPAPVPLLDVELNERPGQFFILPRRARLAGAQPDDRIAHADGLAGTKGDVPNDSVALVEQAEDRHPFAHGRRSGCGRVASLGDVDGYRRIILADRGLGRGLSAPGGGQHQQRQADAHVYSGFHA